MTPLPLLFVLAVTPKAPSIPGVVRRIDNVKNEIALTFDACATKTHGYSFDREIYEILRRERIPATIFVSGRWVEFHTDAMIDLAANPLIEFGNHSYDHPHMPRLTDAQMRDEVLKTETALAVYGKHGVGFRPPFGDLDARMVGVVRAMGMPVILWDVVSGDPSRKVTAANIIHVVTRKTRSGSIVIFHINGRGLQTARALPTVVNDLRRQGFAFVALSQLLKDPAAERPLPLTVESTVETAGTGVLCEPPGTYECVPSVAAHADTRDAGADSGGTMPEAASLGEPMQSPLTPTIRCEHLDRDAGADAGCR